MYIYVLYIIIYCKYKYYVYISTIFYYFDVYRKIEHAKLLFTLSELYTYNSGKLISSSIERFASQ